VIGAQIARYVVLKTLGEGGMGTVVLAEHVDLKTLHAIKMLLPQFSRHPQIVQRFRNEARAAAATRSPNIVAARDFGQLDDGTWYLVMDYWEGSTLSAFLAPRGPLPHALIIRIVADALNGLAAAHARDIIHRDLKPDNLYLADVDGDVRTMILDFGVCRLGENAGVVTRTGTVIGTVRYMAPEQFRGEQIDRRADLCAIGVIVYEMATGGWGPYDDEGGPRGQVLDDATLRVRMGYPPVDPRRRNPAITRALADAILSLIDPDPAKRPATAAAAMVLLAETLPSDGLEPSGIEIVQKRAPDLLKGTAFREPPRAPVPVLAANHQPSKYSIHSRIGSGGMAEVFRAESRGAEGFARPVALKRVLAGFSEMPAFATMFCEEARIASQLSHPNCVSVLDFDRDADGRLFLVMEYVAGKDLRALLETGRVPPSIAIFLASEILSGLQYAHALPNPTAGIRGVVHRDISPNNILISWEGAVKVSDFGIAKALGGSGLGSGTVKGKPAYMSPEQVNAEPLDGRSDLFAVGIVLWEALTGTRLFKGESAKETFGQILFRDAPRPSSVRPGLPPDLEAIVLKLLERDRNARYPTAEQAIEELARCKDSPRNGRGDLVRLLASRFPAEVKARSEGLSTSDRTAFPRDTPRPVAPVMSTLGSAASQSAPPAPTRPSRRRWLLAGLAAAGVAVGTFVVVVAAVRSLHPAPEPPRVAASGGADGSVSVDARLPEVAVTPLAPDAHLSAPQVAADARMPDHAAVAVNLDAGAQPHLAVAPVAPIDAGVPKPATSGPDAGASSPTGNAGVTSPRPAPRQPTETGSVAIYVTPFALVWVDDSSVAMGQTPLHLKLRTGRHRIRLVNERLHKEKTVPVTITTVKEAVIDETW
jgi:eukaryotic-like serine/threonine-protein kinase